MTLYAGETLVVRVRAKDPLTGRDVDDAETATVEFYDPCKNPVRNPADRADPDYGPFPLVWNEALRAYIARVPTSGWTPGRWSMRARLTGLYESWEFSHFEIAA